MLGEFLLPAFTRLGHECQDLFSQCHTRHVCIYTPFILLFEGVLGSGVRTHVNSKGKFPLPEAQNRMEPATLHHTEQRAQHTTVGLILDFFQLRNISMKEAL